MRAGPRSGGGSAGRAGGTGPGRAPGVGAVGPGPALPAGDARARWPRRFGVCSPAAPVQLPESLGDFVLFVGFDLFEAFCFSVFLLLICAFLSRSHPFLALLPGT